MHKRFLISFPLLIFSFQTLCGQNVFKYEYDLGVSGSGYDSGQGGGGYTSSDGKFFICGEMDLNGDPDAYLLKIKANGQKDQMTQYRIDGGGSWEYVSQGKTTADGGYLLYGSTGYNNLGDLLLIKTTSTGALSWAREIKINGATSVLPSKFSEIATGGYLLTGSLMSVGAGQSDAFVISISSDGNTVNFSKAYGTADFQHATNIIEHSTGKISFVGNTRVNATNVFDGWWVELNSTGTTVNYSKSLGEAGLMPEQFNDLIETTTNNYFVIGDICGGVGGYCSGYFTEFNASTGVTSDKKYFTTSPTGTVFSIYEIARTPDNNSYWIGGVISIGGTDNNCLILKTSTATPAPSVGYSFGDSDDQSFHYTSGAIMSNDEFVFGGTENRSPSGFPEWRPTLIKVHSSKRCGDATINFTTSNYATAAADVTTTITNLTTTLYTLVIGTDITQPGPSVTHFQDCFSTLPVSLLSFSGKPENNSVKLFWSTASEENNSFFTVERSEDGKTFTEIGKINGSGNSSTIRNYDFTDESPAQQNYYRLSQTDFNGQHEDLGIISLRLSNDEEQLSLSIQSNPVVNNTLSLNLFSAEENDIIISVTDLQGRILFHEKYILQKGENRLFTVNLEGIAPGTYFLSATARNSSVNRKFLLQNGQ